MAVLADSNVNVSLYSLLLEVKGDFFFGGSFFGVLVFVQGSRLMAAAGVA